MSGLVCGKTKIGYYYIKEDEKLFEQEAGKSGETNHEVLQCSRCGRDENESALFSVRIKGSNKWVCARCLPALIHG
jgi:hypothetical protein